MLFKEVRLLGGKNSYESIKRYEEMCIRDRAIAGNDGNNGNDVA